MQNPVHKLILGMSSVGGLEVANNIEIPTTTETKDIISIVLQIVIGIATLIGMFKKNKKINSNS